MSARPHRAWSSEAGAAGSSLNHRRGLRRAGVGGEVLLRLAQID